MYSVCFVIPGPSKWASSRLRAEWPAHYIPGAVVAHMPNIPEAANYVWIKAVDNAFIRAHPQARHYWDVCDPAWWWNPREAREIADIVTGTVASCKELADDFTAWSSLPCLTIPDRIELSHYPIRREHQANVKPVRFIWYGAFQNRIALFGALAPLGRLVANGVPVELTVFDDQPGNQWNVGGEFPIYYVEWQLERENQIIAAHDIAILPAYPGPWGLRKSNNKNLTAWACGLPVTDGMDYDVLCRLATDDYIRRKEAEINYQELIEDYNVRQSAEEWKAILEI